MNETLKQKIKSNRLYSYEVAAKVGISEYTFCKWLRKELTEEQKTRVDRAIEELKAGAPNA